MRNLRDAYVAAWTISSIFHERTDAKSVRVGNLVAEFDLYRLAKALDYWTSATTRIDSSELILIIVYRDIYVFRLTVHSPRSGALCVVLIRNWRICKYASCEISSHGI
jgi:hypothetical protein